METTPVPPLHVFHALIVDDHRMIRDGLKSMLLSFKKEISLSVTQASGITAAMQYLQQATYDIAIVDYQLGEIQGDELIRRMLRYQPQLKILALSNYNDRKIIEAMTEAGALGYVLKSILPEQMLLAIKTVLSGKNYYCNEVAVTLLTETEGSAGTKKLAPFQLTPRELEVLLLIAEGMTNSAIAEKLFVARRTVDTHRQNLMRKLNVHNTAGLVRVAMDMKKGE